MKDQNGATQFVIIAAVVRAGYQVLSSLLLYIYLIFEIFATWSEYLLFWILHVVVFNADVFHVCQNFHYSGYALLSFSRRRVLCHGRQNIYYSGYYMLSFLTPTCSMFVRIFTILDMPCCRFHADECFVMVVRIFIILDITCCRF